MLYFDYLFDSKVRKVISFLNHFCSKIQAVKNTPDPRIRKSQDLSVHFGIAKIKIKKIIMIINK